jgi:hypothetical protein
MLVDDLAGDRAQVLEAVNVLGVREDGVGQGTRLISGRLVRLVKERGNFGVFRQQESIKVVDEQLATDFQERYRRLDSRVLFFC